MKTKAAKVLVIGVKFSFKGVESQTEYVYKCPYEVKEDDYVVTESTTSLGVARVTRIVDDSFMNADELARATSWVIDVIDFADRNERKEKQDRVKWLKMKLEEKKKALEEASIFELLATLDPASAELLTEYKSLTLNAEVL